MKEVFHNGEEFGAIDDGERPLRHEVDGEDDQCFIAVFGVVFTESFLHVHGEKSYMGCVFKRVFGQKIDL